MLAWMLAVCTEAWGPPCRIILAPIVWPISRILDHCLGRDIGTVYSQEELKRLM